MISATPNSVRWDQVNRVTYRFQALNFQSDVLEALVLNSPPLSRRSRRKPIIHVSKSDSGGNKVEFLKARSLERRSLSFDEGIAENPRNDVKFNEKSRVSHDRYVSERPVVSRLVFENGQKFVYGVSPNNLSKSASPEVSLEKKFTRSKSEDDVNAHCGGDEINESQIEDDLEGKSRQYLVQLIKDLRCQVKELSGCKTNSQPKDNSSKASSQCCRCGFTRGDGAGACESPVKKDDFFQHEDPLASHMHQLESEVLRTKRIATMFEDEITELKGKFSNMLKRADKIGKKKPTTENGPALVNHVVENHIMENVNTKVTELDCVQNTSQTDLNDSTEKLDTSPNSFQGSSKKLVNLDAVSVLG